MKILIDSNQEDVYIFIKGKKQKWLMDSCYSINEMSKVYTRLYEIIKIEEANINGSK